MDTTCTYRGNRDDLLIAYLYDAVEPGDRAAFERHLAGCAACRLELSELGAVRAQLAEWAPPEPAAGWLSGRQSYSGSEKIRRGWSARLGDMPAWAQVAAAMVLVGVAAGAANLNVTYNEGGLTIRTGWMRSVPAPASTQVISDPTVQQIPVAGRIDSAPWRAELVALEQQLRNDMRTSAAQPAGAPRDEAAIMRRVRGLIDESERKQQRELALRVAEVAGETRVQRVNDLRNIDRNLNVLQSNTNIDLMRLYKMTNEVAVKVSQVR